jgi:hypothetical protein
VAKLEAVVSGDGFGPGRKAEIVKDGIHEVAGAVASERAAGAVRSVGAGREAQDEDAGAGISEAGNRASPVGLVEIGAAFGLADTLAVFTEPRAEVAGDDRFANLLEERRRTLAVGGGHCIQ